jgi:hypothetical protein
MPFDEEADEDLIDDCVLTDNYFGNLIVNVLDYLADVVGHGGQI